MGSVCSTPDTVSSSVGSVRPATKKGTERLPADHSTVDAAPRRTPNMEELQGLQGLQGLRIAVVGGGVGGAAITSYLARCSEGASAGAAERSPCSVVLFERRMQPDMPDGGSLHLQGEALEVLADLGLEPAALAAASSGKSVDVSRELYIMRDALVNAMLHPVRQHIDLRANCEIMDMRETPSGVELDHRPLLVQQGGQWARNEDAAVTTESFDLVIGADGNAPTSRTLKIVGGQDALAQPVPMLMIQALVPGEVEGGVSDCEEYLRSGPHGTVGKLSLHTVIGRTKAEVPTAEPGGLQPWAVCTVIAADRDAMRNFPRREVWAETMKQHIMMCRNEAMIAQALRLVDQAERESLRGDGGVSGGRLRAWVPFSKESVPKWRSAGGRCVLLGDAVHLMPPVLGWGASCAMGDARALAGALAEVSASALACSSQPLVDSSWIDAFDRYEAKRREAVSSCLSSSKREARKIVGSY